MASVPSLNKNDRKGGGYLEKLVELLGNEYELWIIGIKQKVKKHSEKIKVLPYINDQSELAQIYSKANVFVNCTLEDTFPTVYLEALACGTPFVTFDTGGGKECIDATCGAVVPRGNIEMMAEQVKKWAQLNCGKMCRARAQQFEYHERFRNYITI